MGRGSMVRRIEQLEAELAVARKRIEVANRRVTMRDGAIDALAEAKEALAGIAAYDNTWQGQEAKAALTLIRHIQAKGRAF